MNTTAVTFEDLALFITEEFTKNNHPNPTLWRKYLSEYVDITMSEKLQMCYINNELRLMFVDIEGDTSDQRFCIADHVSASDWKKLLSKNVIPFLSDKAQQQKE